MNPQHSSLPYPFLSVALVVLLAGSLPVGGQWMRRGLAILAGLAAAACMTAALVVAPMGATSMAHDPWVPLLALQGADGWIVLALCLITLLLVVAAPARDVTDGVTQGTVFLCGANLLAHASTHAWTMGLGWALTALPFMVGRRAMQGSGRHWLLPVVGSTAALAVASAADVASGGQPAGTLPWLLVLAAIVARKGLFPLHGWVVRMFQDAPLAWLAVAFNGRLGSLLFLRFETGHQGVPAWAVDVLSWVILASAVTCSLRALFEKDPRRLLGYLFIGQSALVLGGVIVGNEEGFTGSLVHWLTVAAASSGLMAALRAMQARLPGLDWSRRAPGLAVSAPRLATFFLVFALTLAGLPGTLGYCSQDLVFSGATEHSFAMGLTLVVTSALNAIAVFRIYSHLFLGVRPRHSIAVPDLLPRERWPLVACLVFLLAGGLFPTSVIRWKTPEFHPPAATPGH
ncbi:MAG: proton-conducting transporter membrane subunit [Verrucomicrobiota bacterium]|jgi:NADH-quinone oxidoreductase subunit M